MAQTTGALTAVDAKLEFSPTGAAPWTDMSGETNKVTPGGGDRAVTETHTLGTESPIISVGARARVTLTITVLYTEAEAEAWQTFYNTYYRVKTPVYFRYSPKGGQSGEYQFSGGPGYITSMPLPELSGDSEALLTTQMVWNGPELVPAKAS